MRMPAVSAVPRAVTALLVPLILLAGLAVPTLVDAARGDDVAQPDGPEAEADVAPVLDTPPDHEAEHSDATLAAEQNGTAERTELKRRAIADAFGDVQAEISSQRPNLFAGGTLRGDPSGMPTLYIKGAADALVRDAVANAEIDINLVEGRARSWQELEAQSQRLGDELGAIGYQDFSTSFDEVTATLEATIIRRAGLPATAAAVRDELPAELRGAELTLID